MKYLSEEPSFNRLVKRTARYYDMWPDEIIKDYFMMMALKAVVKEDPNLVMKGGTSLSKAYNIIKRFSEDVDIAVSLNEKYSLSKSKLNRDKYRSVSRGLTATGLDFEAADSNFGIGERRNMNVIALRLPVKLTQTSLLDYVKIEEETFSPAFPIEKRLVQSYLGRFIQEKTKGYSEVLENYPELKSFSVLVQRLERTMADKLMAIADDYLHDRLYPDAPKTAVRSRDLYDISQINKYLDSTDYDWSKFPKLFSAVRRERFLGDQKTAISADPKYNVGKLIELALQDKKLEYADDFSRNTTGLLTGRESILSFDKLLQQVSSLIRQPNFRILWMKQPEYLYATKKQDQHSLSKKKGRER